MFSAFTSGDKTEGLKEVQKIWRRMKPKKEPAFKINEEEIARLPLFSLMPKYPTYILEDSNPNL